MAQPRQVPNNQSTARPPHSIPVFRPWAPPSEALLAYLEKMDASRWYSNFGPLNDSLEQRLAERFGDDTQIVTMANGTLALAAALRARAPNGGLCLMPAFTFVASAHAAIIAGLTPYLVDVSAESLALAPERVHAALARAPDVVGAIVPVAPFGDCSGLDRWRAFELDTKIPVVIDAAAAFDGVRSAETPLIVSLHATKVLGAGEGAFFATKDKALAEEVRALSVFGFKGARTSMMPAFNAKLSEYHAAVALAALDLWPDTRRRYLKSARTLRAAFSDIAAIRFQEGWGESWINTIAMAHTPRGAADRLQRQLAHAGVDTRRWWGMGLHREPAFRACPKASALRETNSLASAMLGLPFAIDLEEEDAIYVARAMVGAL